MYRRFAAVCSLAAQHEGVISLGTTRGLGVDDSTLSRWVGEGLLHRSGPRSFTVCGAPPTWRQALAAGYASVAPVGFVAGRAAAQLYGLDGFSADAVEFLVPRQRRNTSSAGIVRSTRRPVPRSDWRLRDGMRVLTPERMILDAPIFRFTKREVENAIDSAIRLRLVSEARLRERVVAEHNPARRGSAVLLRALVDTGGESRLERRFLALVRRAGLPRPRLQVTYRSAGRLVARVDALFGDDLVIEVAGHGTHSTRSQRQRDEQRRTELTLAGRRVITFTYDDVMDRPDWVVAQLRLALGVVTGSLAR